MEKREDQIVLDNKILNKTQEREEEIVNKTQQRVDEIVLHNKIVKKT